MYVGICILLRNGVILATFPHKNVLFVCFHLILVLRCLLFYIVFSLDHDLPLMGVSIGFSYSPSGFGFIVSSSQLTQVFLPWVNPKFLFGTPVFSLPSVLYFSVYSSEFFEYLWWVLYSTALTEIHSLTCYQKLKFFLAPMTH